MSLKDFEKMKDKLQDVTKDSEDIYTSFENLIKAAQAVYDDAEPLEEGTVYYPENRIVSLELLEKLATALYNAE